MTGDVISLLVLAWFSGAIGYVGVMFRRNSKSWIIGIFWPMLVIMAIGAWSANTMEDELGRDRNV